MIRTFVLIMLIALGAAQASAEEKKVKADPYCGMQDELAVLVCQKTISGFFFGIIFATRLNIDHNGNKITCIDENISANDLRKLVMEKYLETPEEKDIFEVIFKTMIDNYRCK